jgi:hypothetical protein
MFDDLFVDGLVVKADEFGDELDQTQAYYAQCLNFLAVG